MVESKDERDERVAKLWEKLDTRREGHIDLPGLKKGLKNIDHREFGRPALRIPTNHFFPALKNADEMVVNVLQEVDTNCDGRIDQAGKYFEINQLSSPLKERDFGRAPIPMSLFRF